MASVSSFEAEPGRAVSRASDVRAGAAAYRPGFTLLETLVVVSIISMLAAVLLPALSAVRQRMHTLKCLSNLRSVAFQFQLFAEGTAAEGRGESARFGPNRFHANDFQESVYRLDEFWEPAGAVSSILDGDEEPVLCPAGSRQLVRHSGFPCGKDAVSPAQDVSLAMNMRLHRAVRGVGGRPLLMSEATTFVRADILSHPYVPLIMDVDGLAATRRGLDPFYTAPPVPGDASPYSNGRFWMPSSRHRGLTNVAFVGGHVLSSLHPERETWDWQYQAEVGR